MCIIYCQLNCKFVSTMHRLLLVTSLSNNSHLCSARRYTCLDEGLFEQFVVLSRITA